MLFNVVANAVKFNCAEGFIEISADYCRESRKLTTTVVDEGVGMSQEELDALFKPFRKRKARFAA